MVCVCVLAAVFSGCEINNNLCVVDLNCVVWCDQSIKRLSNSCHSFNFEVCREWSLTKSKFKPLTMNIKYYSVHKSPTESHF